MGCVRLRVAGTGTGTAGGLQGGSVGRPATTLNKMCALAYRRRAMIAFNQIALGDPPAQIAGGMETLTKRRPYVPAPRCAAARGWGHGR